MDETKYQLMDEDHRYPRFNMARLATGLDVFYVPDLETAHIVISAIRTLDPRKRIACDYPTRSGNVRRIEN